MPLYINGNIIKNNFNKLHKISGKIPAIVLKSNAYGLGIRNIIPILEHTLCERIFVHSMEEALEIRSLSDKFQIIVLDVNTQDDPKLFMGYNILPLINSLAELEDPHNIFTKVPCVLNMDLGMNRTGLKPGEIINNIELFKPLKIKIIMGHLHITHNIDIELMDPINREEKGEFDETIKFLKNHGIEGLISLASTNVLAFGEDYIYDIPRLGKSLYGLSHKDYGLEEAIYIKETIKLVKSVGPGDLVGYNGHKILHNSHIGILNIGYSSGISLKYMGKLKVKYKNSYYTIISISMEYTIIDFENTQPQVGEEVLLFPGGIIADSTTYGVYYLEQLLNMVQMKKIVI